MVAVRGAGGRAGGVGPREPPQPASNEVATRSATARMSVRGPARRDLPPSGTLSRRPPREREDTMAQAAETRYPFDTSGIERDADGVAHYTDRPPSVVAMLRASVERAPGDPAILEVGSEPLSYQELWDGAARVAGGLREQHGIQPGDRVANRLGNGTDWVLAFFGTLMAGAVAVPVNTRFKESEVAYVV